MEDAGFSPSIDQSNPQYPSKSTLQDAIGRIAVEWLEKALKLIDELSAKEMTKFDFTENEFAIDGLTFTCDRKEKRFIRMRTKLINRTFSVTALVRLPANTIRSVKRHTNKLRPFLSYLPKGSIVTADAEFDVKKSYRDAIIHNIDFIVKQKEDNPGWRKSAIRRRALEKFDKKKYRRRKLGERPFGNINSRMKVLHYRKTDTKLKGALLIAFAHNVDCYFACRAKKGLFDLVET